MKIRRQQTSTMVRGRVSEAVSPFAEQSLNHSLGLAVGPRSVRSGTNVLDAELLARCGEESRAISIAIVGQKASNEDATLGEPSDSSMKEGDRRPLSFVAEYFHVCQSRSVIDANMSELPAGSRSMSPIAGDPMPDPVDPSELLHIDVQQVSGTAPFVSPRRWPRLKTAQTRQTCLPDDSSNRGATEAHRLPICRHVNRSRRSITTNDRTFGGVIRLHLFGRELRSLSATTPPRRCRRSHS